MPDSFTAFAIPSLSRSCSSRDFAGGNIKYAARAPRKALVSAAASLMVAVNASAPWRTKRCSRPTTRTFLPSASRELAIIAGVPARPHNHIRGIRCDGRRIFMAVHIRFPFFLSSQTHCSKLVDSGVVIGKVVRCPLAILVGLKISCLLLGVHLEFRGEICLLDPKVLL